MWDQRYSEEGFAYGVEPNDWLKDTVPTLNLLPQSKCLLLAEGEGRNAIWMAGLGLDVTAMDSSAVGLDKAKQLAKDSGVSITTQVVDLAVYDMGVSKWDCIVGIFCHVPPPIRQRMLAAIPRALNHRGVFVLEAYTPDQIPRKTGGPPVPELMYTSKILSDALKGPLHIVLNQEIVRPVLEGKYHTGDAAVVQFVARKT